MNRQVHSLPLDLVEVGDRLRPVDPDYVALIAASMAERGLDSPIVVSTADAAGRHRLIAGGHRVEAARSLGWAKIDALISDADELQAKLQEIDENLIRRELSALDRAVFLAERKAVYEALNPETKRGGDRSKAKSSSVWSASFAKATAEKLGVSDRAVQMAVRRASLSPEIRKAIATHPVADSGAELDKLLAQPVLVQHRVVELLTGGNERLPNVTAALARLAGPASPSAAGTLALHIGGQRVAVTVASGATVADIATALRTAINAKASLPVVAAGTAGTVTLTAKHAGALGNEIDVRLNRLPGEATPPGLAAAVPTLAGGAGSPDVADALSAIAAEWYTDIACAFTDSANLAALTTELGTRYQAMGRMDAHAYAGLRGTFGTLSSAGAVLNGPHLTMIGAKAAPSSPWAWAASLAGIAAFHLTNDPARQLRGLALPGIIGPAPADRFSPTEQDLLLRDGISTFEVANDGTVRLQRVITTYQKSSLGVDDTAWLDITVPKTLSRIRYDWASYVSLTYPRSKLADDGSPAAEYGEAVVTPRMMHGAWGARCTLYERQGWIEDAARTVAESVFQRNASDRNRMDARQRVRIIGNLMVLAASLQFDA